MYRTSPEAANYLNIHLNGAAFESALLAGAKENLRDCFYTKRGKAKLNLPHAKDVIDDFEKAGPGLASMVDLRLCYLEHGVDIINNYTNVPNTLFNSVDRMFQSVAGIFQKIDDPSEGTALAEKFRSRMKQAVIGLSLENERFFAELEEKLQEVRWISVREIDSTGNSAEGSQPGQGVAAVSADKDKNDAVLSSSAEGFAGASLPPLTDSSPVLPEEDAALFYDLWFPLLDYVNEKRHINDLHDLRLQSELDPAEVKKIANVLWENTDLIDEYLAGPGRELLPEHRSILAGWKHCVTGRFVLERHLKKGSILISMDGKSVYQVRGINSSWEEMFFYMQPPVMIDATLLPYRGIITSDGLVSSLPVSFGGGIKKEFREIYSSAKTRKQILTSLDHC